MKYAIVVLALLLYSLPAAAEPLKVQAITAQCRAFYPLSAVAENAKGSTTFSFSLTDNGRAKAVTLVQSSGRADLDRAAADCLASSRFQTEGGVDGTIWQQNISFDNSPQGGRPHDCRGRRPPGVVSKGITALAFTITDEGNTADITVIGSSGDAALDEAAKACAVPWHYRVVTKKDVGKAIPWKADVTWQVAPHAAAEDAACWQAEWPQNLQGINRPSVLAYAVRGDGRLIDLHVKSSSGRSDLDHAAMTCISRRTYLEIAPEIPGQYFAGEMTIDWSKGPPL